MKKVKLKLTHDQLTAVQNWLTHNLGAKIVGERHSELGWIMSNFLLKKWQVKLYARIQAMSPKPQSLTLDVPTACALLIFCDWIEEPHTSYLGITLLEITNTINQQLCYS